MGLPHQALVSRERQRDGQGVCGPEQGWRWRIRREEGAAHRSLTEGGAAMEPMFSQWTERKIGWGRIEMYNEDIEER